MNYVPTATPEWSDSKRYFWWLSNLPLAAPLLSGMLAILSGVQGLWWVGVMVIFGLIPLIDGLVKEDQSNPPEAVVAALENQRYYRWVVYAAVGMVLVSVVLTAWLCAGGMDWIIAGGMLRAAAHFGPDGWVARSLTFLTERATAHGSVRWSTYLGMALSTGAATGISINTAHELGHKSSRSEQWLAKIALAPTFYGHFFVEHNRGHHVRVATPEDPASARLGETFWAFLPRTVSGSLKSAWQLEHTRLAALGLPTLHWRNELLRAWMLSVLLWGGLIAWLGIAVFPFLLIQGIYGFSLLESVNYVEHYGLLRQRLPDGRYERCSPRHSWNSNRIVTNIFLYQLQRHSDHHAHPTRAYQALRHFDESPQLPYGYATMVICAYVPPLWRRMMDRRVLAHYGQKLALANVQPAQREKLFKKYGNNTSA